MFLQPPQHEIESGEMSSNRKRMPPASKQGEEDPVEQLLQSAQDELLLNLSVNSHMSRVAPDYLLPDLDHRFQALKSSSSSSTTVQSPSSSSSSTTMLPKPKIHHQENTNNSNTNIDPDDLFARFAALKSSNATATGPVVDPTIGFDQGSGDEDNEVEKIIKWAKDAARLDPSPPSDDDDDDDDDDDEDDVGHVPVKKG